MLKWWFTKVIIFFNDEIDKSSPRSQGALVGKFLGQWFLIEFVQKKMKLCLNLEEELHVSSLSEGLLQFHWPFVEAKVKILERGPWSLIGQLLALKSWRLKFQSRFNTIWQARVWLQLFDLPLKLWEREIILKIAFVADTPYYSNPYGLCEDLSYWISQRIFIRKLKLNSKILIFGSSSHTKAAKDMLFL